MSLKKTIKYLAIIIALLLVGAVSCTLLYRYFAQTKIARARAIHSPDGINTLEPVSIGGIDQWIEIRGQSVKNPILLFIHGGPGSAFIPIARAFQDPWEKYFTIVQWDQRGAGKTYSFLEGRHDPYTPSTLAKELFDKLNNPNKHFEWFENSGHFPFVEEPTKFTDTLIQKILPLAGQSTGFGGELPLSPMSLANGILRSDVHTII